MLLLRRLRVVLLGLVGHGQRTCHFHRASYALAVPPTLWMMGK
ncbi:hypothetical protein [Mesorhizobium sp.]|nr:hypothetical protein [Mesorhizobium sp.]